MNLVAKTHLVIQKAFEECQTAEQIYELIAQGIADATAAVERERDVLVAWEAGALSEGQATRILGVDRLDARELRLNAIERGRLLGKRSIEEIRASLKERGGWTDDQVDQALAAARKLREDRGASGVL